MGGGFTGLRLSEFAHDDEDDDDEDDDDDGTGCELFAGHASSAPSLSSESCWKSPPAQLLSFDQIFDIFDIDCLTLKIFDILSFACLTLK